MPAPAFRLLEYVFLALLYLFLLRVVRAVWVELREPRLVAVPPGTGASEPNAVTASSPPASTSASSGSTAAGKAVRKRGLPGQLVLVNKDGRGTAFALDSELTIGRAPGCAVALPDDTFVSQLHARVYAKGDGFWVEDLGSTNGTLLNGRKVTGPLPLRRGDRLQVGQSMLELQK